MARTLIVTFIIDVALFNQLYDLTFPVEDFIPFFSCLLVLGESGGHSRVMSLTKVLIFTSEICLSMVDISYTVKMFTGCWDTSVYQMALIIF